MADSSIRDVIERLRVASETRDWSLEYGLCTVRAYDIGVLFETIRRYGGRRDWTPSDENILALPAPVRRHLIEQRRRIAYLERLVVEADNRTRHAEALLAELRHPKR